MALAEGKSRVLVGPLTLHTRTAIDVTSLITEVSASLINIKIIIAMTAFLVDD